MTETTAADVAAGIEEDRAVIDSLDAQVVELLAQRARVSARIQRRRVRSGGPRTVFSREMDVLARYRDALGTDGTRIAMDVLRLCRGTASADSPGAAS
ncbi:MULTISPECIES: chorismate mutase [unclassified Streptomyces]|uniref:chorismate mutase n=1 Tax=unclassified Streptomyces TaxID=2593676 RepID=UPI0036E376DB